MLSSTWGHWQHVACAMPYDPTVDLAAKNFDDPYQNFEKESYCRHVDHVTLVYRRSGGDEHGNHVGHGFVGTTS